MLHAFSTHCFIPTGTLRDTVQIRLLSGLRKERSSRVFQWHESLGTSLMIKFFFKEILLGSRHKLYTQLNFIIITHMFYSMFGEDILYYTFASILRHAYFELSATVLLKNRSSSEVRPICSPENIL